MGNNNSAQLPCSHAPVSADELPGTRVEVVGSAAVASALMYDVGSSASSGSDAEMAEMAQTESHEHWDASGPCSHFDCIECQHAKLVSRCHGRQGVVAASQYHYRNTRVVAVLLDGDTIPSAIRTGNLRKRVAPLPGTRVHITSVATGGNVRFRGSGEADAEGGTGARSTFLVQPGAAAGTIRLQNQGNPSWYLAIHADGAGVGSVDGQQGAKDCDLVVGASPTHSGCVAIAHAHGHGALFVGTMGTHLWRYPAPLTKTSAHIAQFAALRIQLHSNAGVKKSSNQQPAALADSNNMVEEVAGHRSAITDKKNKPKKKITANKTTGARKKAAGDKAENAGSDANKNKLKSTKDNTNASPRRKCTLRKANVGRRCTVEGYAGEGRIRFFGKSVNLKGVVKWKVGVELDEAVGKNNGTVRGVTYFDCAPKHGVLTSRFKVHLATMTTTPGTGTSTNTSTFKGTATATATKGSKTTAAASRLPLSWSPTGNVYESDYTDSDTLLPPANATNTRSASTRALKAGIMEFLF